MLPAILAAKSLGFKRIYLPYDSYLPLDNLEGIKCFVIHHIQDVLQHLSAQPLLTLHHPSQPTNLFSQTNEYHKGHEQAKQAFEIAAGEHNILMSGPPDCGKSLLAETIPFILPLCHETYSLRS